MKVASLLHMHILQELILIFEVIQLTFFFWILRATHPWWMGVPFNPRMRGKLVTDQQPPLPPSRFHHTFNYFNAPIWLQAYVTKLGIQLTYKAT